MRSPRTFLAFLLMLTLGAGFSACGGEGSTNDQPTTTSGVGPQEVEDPGEGDNVPGDPNTPDPGTDSPDGGNQDDPPAGVGGDQSNPY